MLWIKALHIIFMVTWFAGLFYLPRLFVYHALICPPGGEVADRAGSERFKIMERKLYLGIMTPGGVLTIAFGLWLWLYYGIGGSWLHWKLALVVLLVVYHGYCGILVRDFRDDRNRRGHVFYRWFNELPVLVLVGAVILVVVRPALS